MSYTALPVFPFQHNWSKELLETLEWKTDILVSETGKEQRIQRRLTPRRYFEASFLIQNEARQYFEHWMSTYGGSTFLIPLWHAVSRLTADMQVGVYAMQLDASNREYREGKWAILRGANPQSWETHVVTDISSGSLGFSTEVSTLWPTGTFVYPGMLASIESSARSSTVTDRAIDVTIRFRSEQPNEYDSAWARILFGCIPIFDTPPNDGDELTDEYRRNLSVINNALGLPSNYDVAGRQFKSRQYSWSPIGREQTDQFRKILYWLQGRTKALWMPTYMQDLTLAAPTSIGSTSLVIKNAGYAANAMQTRDRDLIQISMRDGTIHYCTIVASTVINEYTELLGISRPWPVVIVPEEVARISYVLPMRLDQDSVEISHPTDIDGLSHCVATWTEFESSDMKHISNFEGVAGDRSANMRVAIYDTPMVYTDAHSMIYNPVLHEIWLGNLDDALAINRGILRVSAADGSIVGRIRTGGSWTLFYNPVRKEVYQYGSGLDTIISASTGVVLRDIWPQGRAYSIADISPIDGRIIGVPTVSVSSGGDPDYLQNLWVSEYSPVSGNITTLGLVPTSNGWNGQMLFENCAANGFWDAISTTPDAAAYSKVYIREYSEDISGIATTYLLRYDASELIKLVYDVDRDSLWVISKNYLVVNGVRTFAYADTKVHATEFSLRDRAVISVYDITSHGLPASLYFNDNPKYDGVNKVIWYLEKDSKVVGFRTIDGSLFASIDLPALHGIYSPSNLVVVDGNVWLQAYNVSEYCLIKIWHTYN